jgi:CheY-like chemotaxis protein
VLQNIVTYNPRSDCRLGTPRLYMKEPKICLLVDDDPDDQEVFLTALNDVASSVLCLVAPDGDRALELLHNEETIPDYIFLDLNMPRMNGFEFLAAMKKSKILKDIPVIVYSTTAQSSQIEKVKKLGATEFFTKTYKYKELCAMLSRYFGD